MINALGPFQYFFTFSCAELRWTEIIACILRMKGHTVYVQNNKETDSIFVDGDPLLEYLLKTDQKLHEIIRNETFTVTRMFDRKVKSLVRNVLMDLGAKGMNLKYFMYRVEFQARGKRYYSIHTLQCRCRVENILNLHISENVGLKIF